MAVKLNCFQNWMASVSALLEASWTRTVRAVAGVVDGVFERHLTVIGESARLWATPMATLVNMATRSLGAAWRMVSADAVNAIV